MESISKSRMRFRRLGRVSRRIGGADRQSTLARNDHRAKAPYHPPTPAHLPIMVRKNRFDLCRCRHGGRTALQLCHTKCICIALRDALPRQPESAHESGGKGSSFANPLAKS